MLRVAHVTDTHVVGEPGRRVLGVDTAESLASVLDSIATDDWRPDLVVVTGDLSDDGAPSSYRRLREHLLSLAAPTWCVPGNHDDPAAMQRSLAGGSIRIDREFTRGGWRFVMLDSCVPGASHGALREDELARLAATLDADPATPTLVLIHHPPFDRCVMPACRLRDAGVFVRVVAARPHVRAVLAGHVHCATDRDVDGVRVITAPSTCVHADHPCGPHVPDPTEFVGAHRLDPSRRGFRRLELGGAGVLSTEVVWARVRPTARDPR